LTKSAAAEFAAFGVRVNSVHPGLVETPMIQAFLDQPEVIEAFLGPTLIRRLARPEEISNAVLLLASDESSYMTGTALMVDGGFSAV
jgi:NAD(P)-dependent dehydrogenase (short-subunit alcohol dehydrogenase family)